MKLKYIIAVVALVLLVGLIGYLATKKFKQWPDTPTTKIEVSKQEPATTVGSVMIDPVSHASFVLTWGPVVIYNDPVGGIDAFADKASPTLILLSDIHGDHLDTETLEALVAINPAVALIAPQAVYDELPLPVQAKTEVLGNKETVTAQEVTITGVPMYNLPESDPESRHTKGRGNGYLLEKDGERVYIAGDTADIPEMRALTDIDVAFLPMNLPYTMDINAAADATLAFKPTVVIPYHYRTPEGPSDVQTFKNLVNAGNTDIEVLLLGWYE